MLIYVSGSDSQDLKSSMNQKPLSFTMKGRARADSVTLMKISGFFLIDGKTDLKETANLKPLKRPV